MNAKKIMGAVLVALLAAALFTGAGAAATTPVTNGTTVFLYQNITGTNFTEGAWVDIHHAGNPIYLVNDSGSYHFEPSPGVTFVPGTYVDPVNATYLVVEEPTMDVSIKSNGIDIIDGTSYDKTATIATTIPGNVNVFAGDVVVTYPNGVVIVEGTNGQATLTDLPDGEYTVVVKFNKANFVGLPNSYASSTYKFSVVDGSKVSASTDKDLVIVGDAVALTIIGMPQTPYDVNLTKFKLLSVGTENVTGTLGSQSFVVTTGDSGKAVIYLNATEDGAGKIKVEGSTNDEVTLTVTIVEGDITAKTDKEAYYIGEDVVLSGTSTAGDKVWFYIEGTNKDFQILYNAYKSVNSKDEWKLELPGSDFRYGYDTGTYTVYITSANLGSTTDPDTLRDNLKEVTYTTASLVLKQPFISVTNAPSVAVKGNEYIITGTAEATEKIQTYIFGTNFFAAGESKIYINNNDSVTANKIGDVSIEDDEFTIELDIPEGRYEMSTGQYFAVIQHPMYDEEFGIKPVEFNVTLYNMSTGSPVAKEILFTVDLRQTANAAEALVQALDTQNIDDLYVKFSFMVANGESTINPIPSEITQGSKLTVSGQTNLGPGKVVTVEMISTAFSAVPKETVGSASFISVTTKTNEDGSWEITFDTTGLDIDEYAVTAAVEGIGVSSPAKINVIEGAPTEQPTENPTEQPTQTEQPTEAPSTPGFGALAALAGLGAVAVLLLRRE